MKKAIVSNVKSFVAARLTATAEDIWALPNLLYVAIGIKLAAKTIDAVTDSRNKLRDFDIL